MGVAGWLSSGLWPQRGQHRGGISLGINTSLSGAMRLCQLQDVQW
jgi:hypothetical protein